jgi:hypothetical protein
MSIRQPSGRTPAGRLLAVLLLLLFLPFPAQPTGGAGQGPGNIEGSKIVDANSTMRFYVVEVPDSVGGGFEPHILAAPGVDGHQWYYVDSPTGLGSKQSGDLYVSKDYGLSWAYRSKGLISGSWAGSGDSYTTVTNDGVIYFTDLLLVSATVDSSRDGGLSWARNPLASVTPIDDRQWLSMGPTVGGSGIQQAQTLYMSYNQIPSGLWIMTSEFTNLGLGWKPGNRGRPITADTNARDVMTVDQHDGTVYLPNTAASGLSVWVSTDGARSFTQKPVMDGSPGMFQNIFVVGDVDEAGNLYLAWTDQRNVTLAVSSDKAQSWRFLNATTGDGTRVLPWVAGGDDGRVGVVYYETNETGMSDTLDNATWDVKASVCTDVFAPNVTFYTSTVMPAVHGGTIRTSGASGSADRDLGDYMSCDVDDFGRLIMTFGNDGNDGVGKYKSKIMVARQDGGPFLKAGAGPVAKLEYSVDGLQVSASGKNSYDQNGRGIINYAWEWGDGKNDTGQYPTTHHAYRKAGTYKLTLLVTDQDNMTGWETATLKLRAPPGPSYGGLALPLGIAAAVAAGAFVWWKYGKGKLPALGKKGVLSKQVAEAGDPEG